MRSRSSLKQIFIPASALLIMALCVSCSGSSTDSTSPSTSVTTTTTTIPTVSSPSLSYSGSTGRAGAVGYAMTISPTTLDPNGSTISSCGIKSGTTSLPTGLTVATTTCVISGTPSSTSASATYTLEATTAAGISAESTVALSVVTPTVHAYVTDTTGYVYSCSINTATGAFTSYGSGFPNGWTPYGSTIFTISGKVFMAVPSIGVWTCSLEVATGDLSCVNSGSVTGAGFRGSSAITIGGTTYTYLTDKNGGRIYRCPMTAATGYMDSASCTVTNGGIATTTWRPYGIHVTTIGANIFAYITDNQNGNFYVCAVSSVTGDLSACAISNGGSNPLATIPYSIFVASIGANYFAYIANISGHVISCAVNSTTGLLSACADSDGGMAGINPTGVTVSNLGGVSYYAYVAGGDSMVHICSVNTATGALSGCANSVAPTGGWIQPGPITIFVP